MFTHVITSWQWMLKPLHLTKDWHISHFFMMQTESSIFVSDAVTLTCKLDSRTMKEIHINNLTQWVQMWWGQFLHCMWWSLKILKMFMKYVSEQFSITFMCDLKIDLSLILIMSSLVSCESHTYWNWCFDIWHVIGTFWHFDTWLYYLNHLSPSQG